MAARRLAISSLLCDDNESDAPLTGPIRTPPNPDTHRHVSPASYPTSSYSHPRARPIDHDLQLSHQDRTPSRADAVPISFQPALHLRRRTPSPSPPLNASPPYPTATKRRTFKEIAFDDYEGPADTVKHAPLPVSNDRRRHSHHTDPSRSSSTRTSQGHGQSGYPQYVDSLSGSSYTAMTPAHLSNILHSPSHPHSPTAPAYYHHESHSSPSNHNVQPMDDEYHISATLRHVKHRPSLSPLQSVHAPLPALSPPIINMSLPQQSPQTSPSVHEMQLSTAPASRHAISSLLTHSPPTSRASAASLPHILNSPIMTRSPALGTPASGSQSSGLVGLEALAQAATQERRRLSGEVVAEEVVAATHLASASRRSSPVIERGDSSLRLSPQADRNGMSLGRVSPMAERIPAQTMSPYVQYSRMQPPLSSVPVSSRSPLHAPSSPAATPARSSLSSAPPRSPETVIKPSVYRVPSPVARHTPPAEYSGEPPMKRRRYSDGEHAVHSPSVQHKHLPVRSSSSELPNPSTVKKEVNTDGTDATMLTSEQVLATPTAEVVKVADVLQGKITADSADMVVDIPIADAPPGPKRESNTKIIKSKASRKPRAPVHGDSVKKVVDQEKKPAARKRKGESKAPANARSNGDEATHLEKKYDAKVLHPDKVESKIDDDPHDWLMEHYGGVSPSRAPSPRLGVTETRATRVNDHDASARSTRSYGHDSRQASGSDRQDITQTTNRHAKEADQSIARSPTPLEMLKEELDAVEGSTHHVRRESRPSNSHHTSPKQSKRSDIDADIESELDFALGFTRKDPQRELDLVSEMDVEDELLSLLDDKPHARLSHSHSSKHRSSPSPATVPEPTPSKPSKHSTQSNVTSERESMPPPPVTHLAHARGTTSSIAKPDEIAITASMKKKAPASKPTTKKPPAKSKVVTKGSNVAVKTKAKASANIEDGDASTPGLPASNSSLTVPSSSQAHKSKKASPSAALGSGSGTAVTAKRAISASAGGSASRSRSTSVLPGTHDAEKAQDKKAATEEPEDEGVDDKLYCICKTSYDEDKVMIACDRCDEWYHTQCVNMPDLEVDLVDQFICPICVKNNPNLDLQTTYKQRCLYGLRHPHPSSAAACHKPSRGAFSKYCSDECGVKYMQQKVRQWKGGVKGQIWEGVKDAEKREAVVVRCSYGGATNGIVDGGHDPRTQLEGVGFEVVRPSRTKSQREIDRFNDLLSNIATRREALKKAEGVAAWRERLVELAVARTEQVGQCGWDQRLCFGDDEVAEYGADVLLSYESKEDSQADETAQTDDAGEWWCRGKKKCDRHAGWQKLRQAEVGLEKELLATALEKLTTEEREVRKRVEDVTGESKSQNSPVKAEFEPLKQLNGESPAETVPHTNGNSKTQPSGRDASMKKGKKRKTDAR